MKRIKEWYGSLSKTSLIFCGSMLFINFVLPFNFYQLLQTFVTWGDGVGTVIYFVGLIALFIYLASKRDSQRDKAKETLNLMILIPMFPTAYVLMFTDVLWQAIVAAVICCIIDIMGNRVVLSEIFERTSIKVLITIVYMIVVVLSTIYIFPNS